MPRMVLVLLTVMLCPSAVACAGDVARSPRPGSEIAESASSNQNGGEDQVTTLPGDAALVHRFAVDEPSGDAQEREDASEAPGRVAPRPSADPSLLVAPSAPR
jgi:hypothetical protein